MEMLVFKKLKKIEKIIFTNRTDFLFSFQQSNLYHCQIYIGQKTALNNSQISVHSLIKALSLPPPVLKFTGQLLASLETKLLEKTGVDRILIAIAIETKA